MPDEEYYLEHTGEEVDGCIDEVTAARGSSASLSAAISAKQDALTFDSAPTESSTNPVTSGGVYSSQQAQDSAITVLANAGAKNLLHVTATSTGGVIINSDGTITIDGTYGFVSITLGSVTLKPGRYVLSSGVNMPNLFYLTVQVEEGGERYSCRQGVESISFDVPQEMTLNRVWFSTTNGASADNMTIRPMIRRAEIADDTFIPYAPTNRELYEMILALQSGTASVNRAALVPSALESASKIDVDDDEEVTE